MSTEAEAVAAARQLQARRQAARDEAGITADGRSDEGPGSPSAGMSVLVKRGAAGCTLVPPGGGAPLSQAAFPVDKVPCGRVLALELHALLSVQRVCHEP